MGLIEKLRRRRARNRAKPWVAQLSPETIEPAGQLQSRLSLPLQSYVSPEYVPHVGRDALVIRQPPQRLDEVSLNPQAQHYCVLQRGGPASARASAPVLSLASRPCHHGEGRRQS